MKVLVMNKEDNKVYLVGSMGDDGKVRHIKGYTNVTWALKNGKALGSAARYAIVEGEFSVAPPEPREVPLKPTKIVGSTTTSAEVQ